MNRSSSVTIYIFCIYFLMLTISGIIAIVNRATFWGNFFLGFLSSNIASLALIFVIDMQNIYNLSLSIQPYIASILFPNRNVRVSMAYLFRIEIDGKYLLITNMTRGHITPIGGAYKYFESAKSFLRSIKAQDAVEADKDLYPEKYTNDLRLLFPLKELKSFLHWFDSGIGREYDPLREFYEELIDTQLLPNSTLFKKMNYTKYATFRVFNKYNNSKKYYSIYHFDIFNIDLTKKQSEFVKEQILSSVKISRVEGKIHNGLFLVTKDEIDQKRLLTGLELGSNVEYIL